MFKRTAVLGMAFATVFSAAPLAVAQDDPVVATVDGAEIRRSEVISAQESLPREYQAVPVDQIYPALLNSLIDSKLVAKDARAQGLQNEPAFKEELARVVDQLLERFAVRKLIEDELTEEKMRAFYEENLKAASAEVHARHILLEDRDAAVAVIKELDGGADFAELAKTKSTGPSASRGGDLGYFGAGQMVPAFEAAAFALDVGSYSKEPVQTQFGFHVIKVEEKRDAAPPAYEDSVDQIRAEMAQNVGTAYVEKLREAAKIERFNLDGSKP